MACVTGLLEAGFSRFQPGHDLPMPTQQGSARLDHVTRQWHDLAERRLAYFTELYRSGRWRRYYQQEQFALRMLDVIRAARAWRDLARHAKTERPVAQNKDFRSAA